PVIRDQIDAGRWKGAICCLDRLLMEHNLVGVADSFRRPDALAYRGHACLMLGQWKEACADFSEAITQGGDAWWGRGGRAVGRAMLDADDKAMADLREAVKMADAEKVLNQLVYLLSYHLERNDGDATLWALRGRFRATFKQYADAVRDLTEALRRDDTD